MNDLDLGWILPFLVGFFAATLNFSLILWAIDRDSP